MPVFRTVKDARQGSIRLEAIHQPLYDSIALTSQTSVTLFSLGNNGRSALLTNLQTAGASLGRDKPRHFPPAQLDFLPSQDVAQGAEPLLFAATDPAAVPDGAEPVDDARRSSGRPALPGDRRQPRPEHAVA